MPYSMFVISIDIKTGIWLQQVVMEKPQISLKEDGT